MGVLTARVRAKLDEQVRALARHAEGVQAGEDPEHVHQLRVSLRRARAVLRAAGTHEPLQAELKWLAGACGDVRDADVLLVRLRESACGFGDDERAAVERLLTGLAEQRRGARRHMLAALRSARYRNLLTSLEEAAREVEPAHADVVKRPHRTFAKAVAGIGDDPADDELHRLRVRGKRLRYAAELAREKKLVKAAKKLQDVLGEHQDAVVAEERVRALLAALGDDAPVTVAFAAGLLVERERARRSACRARWRAVAAKVEAKASAL